MFEPSWFLPGSSRLSSADPWPDHVRLSGIEPGFVCACGKRGAEAAEVFPGQHGRRLVPWSARFVDPIVLPDGRKPMTLRDAATCITGLPKAEHDAVEWQIAMKTLLLVAERDEPEMTRGSG